MKTRHLTSPIVTGSRIRPELQGLRAVAVLLVLGFHLWPDWVRGGYVGVDVFFVLSGFLISSHLAAESARTGGIALRQFWARRVRRLLPAASIVLVASLLLMMVLVPQSLWQRTVTEIGASALYVQNWALYGSAVDYLGAENVPTLVQHYWSLSVEEQFYLVWPLLFLLGLAVRRLRLVLAAVLIASLCWAVLDSSVGAYFNTAGRAWEFAAGALLAIAPPLRIGRLPVLSLLGCGLVVGAGLLVTGFSAIGMLVPVVGTLLVIAAGPNRALAVRPLTLIGDVSYGIYLWHWPLLVVAPYLFGAAPTPSVLVGVLLASIALAVLMKRFVEDPLRFAPALHLPRRAFGLAAVSIVVIVAASGVTWGALGASSAAAARQSVIDFETKACYGAAAMVDESCAAPFAVPASMDPAFAPVDKGSLAMPCSATDAEVVRCEFGTLENPRHTIALIGNSHAGALVAGFEEYALDAGWKVVLMRKTGCVGISTDPLTTEYDPECTTWTRAVLDAALSPEFDAVVFATNNNSSKYLGPADASHVELRANIAANLALLVAAGKSVIAIGDVSATASPAPECVDLHHLQYDPCATPRADGEERGNLVAEAARATPGVRSFSLLPYLCDAALCHVMIGGVVVYIDEHHLSASFSRSLGPYLGAEVARGLR